MSRDEEVKVAVGVLIPMPGATQQLYDQVDEALQMETSGPPEGLILHSAGPMPDGWYVYDIWDTREQFQRFEQEKVAPAVEQITGAEMKSEPQFFDIANLLLVGQTVS